MQKIVLAVLSLALFAAYTSATTEGCCGGAADCQEIVCQPCNDYKRCPECFPNGPNAPRVDFRVPCCKQLSQVVALTAASVEAATEAFAAAEACSYAATRVVVAASAGASVGAFVSICQSLSLTINTGKCCEISQDVQANASAYAASWAQAAAEAEAAAGAVAKASAASAAASAAAASLFAQAESLIKSTCCGFDLEVYSAVLAAGNYAVSAKACAKVASQVSTSAYQAAKVCSQAASQSQGSVNQWVRAKVDNCCVTNYTQAIAYDVAGGCLKVCDAAKELHGYCEAAFDYVADYASEENAIETPLELVDDICASECKDVLLSCCQSPCGSAADSETCCLASKSVVQVYLAAHAIAQASAAAATYSESVAQVYAETIAVAYTAAKAAAGAAASINVNVRSCCSITIVIETAAVANAKAVAVAFSQAQAAAQAFSQGYATAQSLSQAVAQGVAAAKACVAAYYNDCCGSPRCNPVRYLGTGGRLSCCDYTENVVEAYSNEYINLVSEACSAVESISQSQSGAATGAKASDCTNIIRRVTTKSAFLLQCCCCNTKNVIASTVRANGFQNRHF